MPLRVHFWRPRQLFRRLKSPALQLLHWMGLSGVLLTLVGMLVVARAVRQDIIIEPFASQFRGQESRYDPNALSRRIEDEMRDIYRLAHIVKVDSFEMGGAPNLPDINIAESGVSLQAIIDVVQTLPFFQALHVSGEIEPAGGSLSAASDGPVQITVRMRRGAAVLMRQQRQVPAGNLNACAAAIAQAIVAAVNPGVFAAYLAKMPGHLDTQILGFVSRVRGDPQHYRNGIVAAGTALAALDPASLGQDDSWSEDQATEVFELALRLVPDDPDVYRNYGAELLRWRKAPRAIEMAKKFVAIDGQNWESHFALASALDDADCRSQAIEEYWQSIYRYPRAEIAYLRLSADFMLLKKFTDARAAIQEYVKRFPQDAGGYLQLGRFLAGSGKCDDAEDTLLRALAIDPRLSIAYETLAIIAGPPCHSDSVIEASSTQGTKEAANTGGVFVIGDNEPPWYRDPEQIWRHQIKATPWDGSPYSRLSKLYEHRHDLPSAERILRSFLSAAPDNSTGYRLLSAFLRKQDRNEESDAMLRKAVLIERELAEKWAVPVQ